MRARRGLALVGEPDQEGLDIGAGELGRVTQAVETDEGAHPVQVGLFGAAAVVQQADLVAEEVEQAGRSGTVVEAGHRSTYGKDCVCVQY